MSNMSSFYGGRSGAPFTIVKTFDAIDLDSFDDKDKPVHTKTYYALSEDGKNFEITGDADTEGAVSVGEGHFIIKKTNKNYLKHNWQIAINNGSPVNKTSYKFPNETAEGMVQLFSKGINSLEEVNYQEYVLIDTVTRMNDYSNPDNGKLFRRGMNLDNGLGGAEYIGRIIGAQGFNTGIQADEFSDIENLNINVSKGTIVSELVAGNELAEENDGIKYIYANILDEGGNVLETKIGFKFPYLVNTFKSDLVVPYNLPSNLITEIKENGEALQNSTDNPNPFYRHWSIKIPNGKKGDSIELIRKQPTLAPAGINYYTSLDNLRKGTSAGTLTSAETISSNKYLIDEIGAYIQLDTNKFVKVEDCTNNKVFYIIRNYNNSATGELSDPIEAGDVDSIIKTNLANDGTLTFYYDNGETENAKNNIRWINNLQVNTEGDNPNYKLHVTYNTPKSNDIKEEDIGESISYIKNLQVNTDGNQKLHVTYNIKDGTPNKEEDIGAPINYIKEMYISNEKDKGSTDSVNISSKHLFVKYSDPKKQNAGVTIAGKEGGWIDLGSVEPPAANVQILTGVPNKKDHLFDREPPEVKYHDIKYKGAVIPANDTNILYYYDYINEKWVSIGTVGQGNVTSQINYIGKNEPDTNNMYVGSLWFQVFEKEEL